MLSKKFKLLSSILVVMILALPLTVFADQPTNSQSGTVNGTPDKYVEIVMENNAINYGTLNISAQSLINTRSDTNGKYVIFDSQALSPSQSIKYNQGASNANIFAKTTYVGETYPTVSGLDDSTWLFFKDNAGTGYVQSEISGTLTVGGGGVTMPTGVTEIGSFSQTFIYYTNGGSGTVWSKASKTIYVALGDDSNLYVSDSADLTTASFYSAKGEAVSTPFYGNNMVESSAFPTMVSDNVTLDFGSYIPWNSVQGSSHQSYSTLIDIPMNAAYNHTWTWALTVTGEYQSAV